MFLELQSTNTAHQHVASLAKVKNLMFYLNFGYDGVSCYHKKPYPAITQFPCQDTAIRTSPPGAKSDLAGFPPKML